MSTPADRKNQLVWDQIDIHQYKQALQLCNRRIKKGEKSEFLFALKAFVLTNMPGIAYAEEAEKTARSVAEKQPPCISLDVLRLLGRVWINIGDSAIDEISKMWERAVKAQPLDEDLAREWFWGTVKIMDWRGAQRAAMNLQKTFAKRREYWFWAVVSTLLLHNSLPEDSPERKLYGTLSYRMLAKARDETPVDTTVIPPRAIQTSQEVNLLLELLPYVAPGDAKKEALEVLNSKNLGVDSTVGSGDWWGLARKRLDLLEETKDWKCLFDSCKSLLPTHTDTEVVKTEDTTTKEDKDTSGRGDDWRVWKGFVQAAGKLYEEGDKEVSKRALDLIVNHRQKVSIGASRNGDLALVKFSSLFHDSNDGPEGTPTLLEAIEEYFDRIGSKSCCYEDLQEYLEMLEDSEKTDFLKHLEGSVGKLTAEDDNSKIAKIATIINQQKFAYLLTISPLNSASQDTTQIITDFIKTALDIYASSLSLGTSLLTTDNQHGDDAAILAVMGLVRLFNLTPTDQTPLYQTIIILEALLQKSKHNYQALLILVRIYLYIGAIGLALDIYPRLNIKQIQNDTLSHFLLTRMSTLFPSEKRVPFFLSEAGGIYDSSRQQAPNMIQLAFERGGYAQMMGFLEFSDRVSGSLCRSMWEVELRRLVRLTNFPYLGPMSEVGIKGQLWDNRDFAVVLDCELSTVGSFEKSCRLGPTPSERWVRAFAAAEEVLWYLESYLAAGKESNGAPNGAITTKPVVPENTASKIAEAIKADEEAESKDQEFTNAEKWYLGLISVMSEAIVATVMKDGDAALMKLEEIHTTMLPKALDKLPEGEADWSLLHSLWMVKDSCAVTELLIRYLGTLKTVKPAIPKTAITTLSETIKTLKADIETKSKESQAKIEDDDAIQVLVDGVLAEDGIGKVLRSAEVFGGIEKVAEAVKRTRGSVANCFESL
ncbi:N-acetyltransferase B complex non catalytic subunit-domain-containing protein [Geopyxis carbonaria]|nr:N-acetyltransferase B complex non catalytic subunit-domain-containing protein [Geopyxis carbonaria]